MITVTCPFQIELRYELIDLKVTYEDWARSMLDDDQPTDQIALFVLRDMLKVNYFSS